jgi:hypothetical protein
VTRLLEGPLEDFEVEGSLGSGAPNHGLPRFQECSFAAVSWSDATISLNRRFALRHPLRGWRSFFDAEAFGEATLPGSLDCAETIGMRSESPSCLNRFGYIRNDEGHSLRSLRFLLFNPG